MSWSTIRRAMWLAFLGGGATGIVVWLRNRRAGAALQQAPEWPPLTTVPAGTVATTAAQRAASGTAASGTATSGGVSGRAASGGGASSQRPTTGAAASFVNDLVDAPEARSDTGWVAPRDDGTCPASHPIKANDNSGIYHVPGGRFYDRTNAERCYPTPEAAAADGYRAAKA